MKRKVSKKAKRRLFVITTAILVVSGFLVFSVFRDWKQILDNRRKTSDLNNQYQALLEEEEKLNSEVNKLSDPDYVARYAREKYLFSLPDEIIIRKSEN